MRQNPGQSFDIEAVDECQPHIAMVCAYVCVCVRFCARAWVSVLLCVCAHVLLRCSPGLTLQPTANQWCWASSNDRTSAQCGAFACESGQFHRAAAVWAIFIRAVCTHSHTCAIVSPLSPAGVHTTGLCAHGHDRHVRGGGRGGERGGVCGDHPLNDQEPAAEAQY